MYKHLNEIMRKNNVRNARRKESLDRKKKVTAFGKTYRLSKSVSEMNDASEVLEELHKGELTDAMKKLGVTVGLVTAMGATEPGGFQGAPAKQSTQATSQMRQATKARDLGFDPSERKGRFLQEARERYGLSHGITPDVAREYIDSDPRVGDMYGPLKGYEDRDLQGFLDDHQQMGKHIASAHYDRLQSEKKSPAPTEEEWRPLNKMDSWLADTFRKR